MKPEISSFTWEKKYETGITAIDDQHRNILKRVNQLQLAIYNNSVQDEILEIEHFLSVYIREHFQAEERLMSQNNYPDFGRHKLQHGEFTERYNALRDEIIRRGPDYYLAIRVEKELRSWWTDHILKTDMLFVPRIKVIPEIFTD